MRILSTKPIVANENKEAVRVNVNNLPYGKDVRRKIEDEFKEVLRLMNFNTKGHDIFRRWYVDGRIFYQKLLIEMLLQKVSQN